MTMPGLVPQITTPPLRKTILQCCGYVCMQGKPGVWQCPGCGVRYEPKTQ